MPLAALSPVISATWPPAQSQTLGPFTIPEAPGGGNRVNAARLTDPEAMDAAGPEIDAVLDRMGAGALFMVLDHQAALDAKLAARGLKVRDATLGLTMPCARLAAPPPPVTCFATWPPLAIQEEIWATSGIGPARIAIMDRAAGPKMSFFGRINEKPAGTAYTALHGPVAMLHALEILPGARRFGLASIMMRAAGDWALSAGAETFSVLVTRENQPAQALYSSLGFEAVGHYHYRTITA